MRYSPVCGVDKLSLRIEMPTFLERTTAGCNPIPTASEGHSGCDGPDEWSL